jgi:NADH:ubiquinone oxidoreductase subunit K
MIIADHASLYAILLFTIGLAGLLARREIVARLVSIEILLAAALLQFVAMSHSTVASARPAPGEAVGFVVIVLGLIVAAFGAVFIAAPGGQAVPPAPGRIEQSDEDEEKTGEKDA